MRGNHDHCKYVDSHVKNLVLLFALVNEVTINKGQGSMKDWTNEEANDKRYCSQLIKCLFQLEVELQQNKLEENGTDANNAPGNLHRSNHHHHNSQEEQDTLEPTSLPFHTTSPSPAS